MLHGKSVDESAKTGGRDTGVCEYIRSRTRDGDDMVGEEEHPADQRFLREVHHRVKNNLQVVCSLLRIEGRRVVDRETLAVFKRSEERIQSMALVYDTLYRSDGHDLVPLHEYLQQMMCQLVSSVCDRSGRPTLSFQLAPIFVSSRMATTLGLLVNEIVSNHLRENSRGVTNVLSLCLKRDAGRVEIELSEDGAEETSRAAEGDIEHQILRALVKQVKGTLTSSNNGGISTRLSVPAAVLEADPHG